MIGYLKKLLRLFSAKSAPRFAQCAIVQFRIAGLNSIADQIPPDHFVAKLAIAKSRIEEEISFVKGVSHAFDIGDYVIGIPSDVNPNFTDAALALVPKLERIVDEFLAAVKFKSPSVRCFFGLASGEAFFTTDFDQVTVAGQVVNEAGYAVAAAESLQIRLAFDSEFFRLVSDRCKCKSHPMTLGSHGKERIIFEPIMFP